MQNPPSPLWRPISAKEWMIFSDLPTISCCLTISKGFLTKLPTISAQIDANTFLKGLSGIRALMDSYVQKKVKEQGNETIIWHEKPLNLLRAIEVRFSPGEDPIICVLIVSSGQKTVSTAIPASPPATPCFKSAIIIIDNKINQYSFERTCPNFHRQLLKQAFSFVFSQFSSNLMHFFAQSCKPCLSALQSSGQTSRKASIFSIFCCLVQRRNSIFIQQLCSILHLRQLFGTPTILSTSPHKIISKTKQSSNASHVGRLKWFSKTPKKQLANHVAINQRLKQQKDKIVVNRTVMVSQS